MVKSFHYIGFMKTVERENSSMKSVFEINKKSVKYFFTHDCGTWAKIRSHATHDELRRLGRKSRVSPQAEAAFDI